MTALATDSGRKTPTRLASSAILALQSDDRLVKLVRTGHERAFDAIVERYRRPLIRFCGRILPESRCEDAVQQAFINAHAALTSSDEPLQLKPWLFAITRNAALNMLRQNGWNYDEIPLDFDGVRRPDQVFEQRREIEETVAALNDLPQRQREALVMREFEGRSYDEIALALGANDGAVRQLLNRARVALRGAVSALVPPPLVARAAASLPPGDGRRIAEVLGGLGAAGVAKAGATALVAGTLVVGAVEAPLPIGRSHKPTRQGATLHAAAPAIAHEARDVTVAARLAAPRTTHRTGAPTSTRKASGDSRRHHSSPAVIHRSGSHESGDGSRDRSRGGSDGSGSRSGSGDGSRTRVGSDDHSGSGRSGSGDVTTTTVAGSGDSGSSGSSGPGTSGGDSSGSGSGTGDSSSSGSGSSGSGSSGSGSGSDGSTVATLDSSGSGSGSGTSGSSSDTLEH